MAVIHLTGPVLVTAHEQRQQAWVIDGRLSYRPPIGSPPVTTVAGYILPGLVDAHCHVGLAAGGAVERAAARRQAEINRDVGVLLIRDAGSPADTRWMDGAVDLPHLIRAGRHIARTTRYLRHYAEEVEPPDLVGQVRRQAQAGDGWVKIVADWIDRDLGDLAPCWPAETLRAAVVAAHAEGVRITAHCFGADALPDLLAAGFDGIEHACGLSADTIAQAAERQIAIVPTLVNIATFPELAARGEGKFPRWAAHMRSLHQRRYDTVRAAAEAGVPMYCGTDAGGSLPHGLIATEVAELARAGLPSLAALDAAVWSARAWLGRPGLVEGELVDAVIYPADPRRDLAVLAHPRLILLRGRIVSP
ncbi:MAG: amidohydrolase family protein [Actinomycetota bacterium]